jgi:hypothetical protein
MSETESELSSKVIPSLLNKIIYSNEIGLQVSEIEGDAVLFFKTGPLPSLKELINQCIHFYRQFYKELGFLRERHKMDHKSINIPEILGLKIILHFGSEVESVQIGKHIKLIGEDVIVAHKLLKNEVPKKEYLLLSENLLAQYNMEELKQETYWCNLQDGGNVYEHIGNVNYTYIDLQPLLGKK